MNQPEIVFLHCKLPPQGATIKAEAIAVLGPLLMGALDTVARACGH
jgi:hypothetical protein